MLKELWVCDECGRKQEEVKNKTPGDWEEVNGELSIRCRLDRYNYQFCSCKCAELYLCGIIKRRLTNGNDS